MLADVGMVKTYSKSAHVNDLGFAWTGPPCCMDRLVLSRRLRSPQKTDPPDRFWQRFLPFSIPGVRYRRTERCRKLSPSSGNGLPPRKPFAIGRNRSHSASSFAVEVHGLSFLSGNGSLSENIRYRPKSKSFCFFVHNRSPIAR